MTMKRLNNFLRYVMTADDETLLMSRMHCHAFNVSSIVLNNTNGLLTRVFLAFPWHRLAWNGYKWQRKTVGIHDHTYDFVIDPIAGVVINDLYQQVDTDDGVIHQQWLFRSGVETGQPVISKGSQARLRWSDSLQLESSQFLDSDKLHTIVAYGPAAWKISEQRRIDGKKVTSLFLSVDDDRAVSDEGLYQKFESAASVRTHCLWFVREFQAAFQGS